MSNHVVITRHPALVDYLLEIGLINADHDVIDHATPAMVADKHVIGVLPHSLSCLTKTFTEIPLNLPAELRGKELSLSEIRTYAGKPITYEVRRVTA